MAPPNVLVFPDPEPLAHALADDLAQHVRAAVAASLFPGHAALADERPRAFPYSMPRNRQRSASPLALVLVAARQRIVVATGRGKRELVGHVQRGADLPVMRVQPTSWYLDAAATEVLRDNAENRMLHGITLKM